MQTQTCYLHQVGAFMMTISIFLFLLELHPIFYGCFDWHSSVHGHWLLARALAMFPGTELADNITTGQTETKSSH